VSADLQPGAVELQGRAGITEVVVEAGRVGVVRMREAELEAELQLRPPVSIRGLDEEASRTVPDRRALVFGAGLRMRFPWGYRKKQPENEEDPPGVTSIGAGYDDTSSAAWGG
jgi:hypothetical protein